MRVIAGSARRLRLITLEGLETRPTGDKIKETLFNILQFGLPDTEFLDLFSGSGAIAIEALSRGAARAVLVENNRRAAECIRTNLETTHFTDKAELMLCDVMTAIRRLEDQHRVFDFIYMDPPFRKDLERAVLERLALPLLPLLQAYLFLSVFPPAQSESATVLLSADSPPVVVPHAPS